MLTLFSCPKPFRGHSSLIQRNAIQSWLQVKPKPEVILIGTEEGLAEAVCNLDIRHLPEVERNSFGTPLLRSIFGGAERAASYPTLCYINADIILLPNFFRGVARVLEERPRSLMVGRRWNLDVRDVIDFSAGWEKRLSERVAQKGKLYPHFGIDYFVFPKGVWGEIPSFAIGRLGWDNWLICRARALNLPIVDLTRGVTVVHQNHDYSHHPQGWAGAMKGVESKRNLELAGEVACVYSLHDANYSLTRKGVKRRVPPYYSPFYLYRSLVICSQSLTFLKPLVRLIKRIGNRFFSHP